MVNNFYQPTNGVFFGRVLFQADTKIGGAKSVFVNWGGTKNDLVTPAWGGIIQNPPKGSMRMFAGDLFELRYNDKVEDPKLYLLKTFKVKSQETTTVKIYRDGYSHIPFVGDVLMKAPDTMGGQGKAYTVQSVTPDVDDGVDVWVVVFKTQIDTVTDGDILVEAESESATGKMLLQTINCVAPCDGDFVYAPTGVGTGLDVATYLYAPVMHSKMYIHKMSPLPACVLKLNKSRFNGVYEV